MLGWFKGRRSAGAAPPDTLAEAQAALAAGQDAAAVALLDRILARSGADPHALHLRAVAACRAGDFDTARALLERAVGSAPAVLEPWLTLAEVHLQQGRFDDAVAALQGALGVDPSRTDTCRRLLQALGAAGRQDTALEYWQLMRGLDWRCDPATNPAAVLHAQGRLVEAEAFLEGRARHAPGQAYLHLLLGITRQARGRLDDAIAAFREAVRAGPDLAAAHGRLAFALDAAGEVGESLSHYRRAAELAPTDPQAWSDYLAARLYAGPHDRDASAEAYQAYDRRFGVPLRDTAPFRTVPDADRRLRIGYVSNDFCEHVIAYFLQPVLERHDRAAFEVWCYDRTPQEDATSARMRTAADVWRRVPDLALDDLARRIREDGIDVLVDLKGHFDGSHLPLFAHKPAPLQFTWLGYPDTTGLSAVDGWITDEHIAAGMTEQYAAEEIVALPGFFMCFRPKPGAPDPGPLPARSRGHVTFGCFNAFSKVSPPMRQALVEILRAVPDARLLMTAVPRGEARRRLLEGFSAAGVDPARIEIRGRGDHEAFLAWHREVDLALDSFPYNGTTTTLHSLWMGVPFVALAGTTHVARVGASILANAGLEDWIATDADDYARIAVARASDLDGLAALRGGLRQRLAASPVLDEAGFTARLEAAFRSRWHRWCDTAPRAAPGAGPEASA